MTSSVLLYHCEGPAWTKLRNMMMLLRFRIRVVTKEQYALPIDQLAIGKGDTSATSYEGEDFNEPMLVLCNISTAQLNPVLEVVRRLDLPAPPLKAMMTPTNRSWNSMELYAELCKEREAMAQAKAEKAEQTTESEK